MAKPDWRSATAYDYLTGTDSVDLAWEFLRRNPEYCAGYQSLREQAQPSEAAEQALARHWGLRCPGRS